MKKTALITISLVLALASASAYAGNNGSVSGNSSAGEEKKKHVRKADPSPKAKGFWAREAERSGLAGTAAMVGNGIANATPFAGPNSGKKKAE